MNKLTVSAHNVIRFYIQQYYNEYEPKKYERTLQFLNSCVMVHPKKKGNTYSGQVYIDYKSMSYTYFEGTEAAFDDDGQRVVEAAASGEHGVEVVAYQSEETFFWNDGLVATAETILNDFEKWLRTETGCDVLHKNNLMF